MSEVERLGKIISAYLRGVKDYAWDEDVRLAKYIIEAGYLPVEPVSLEVPPDAEIMKHANDEVQHTFGWKREVILSGARVISQATIDSLKKHGTLYRRKE